MAKLRLEIEVDYNAESMHGDDIESMVWFREVLLGDELLLHSNEIGDTVGTVKVRKVIDWQPSAQLDAERKEG